MSTSEGELFEDSELAALQLDAGDQDARLSEEERVKKTGPGTATIALKGKEFHVSEEVSTMALMEWAASGDSPPESGAGLTAIYHMLESVVHADDWLAFKAHARTTKANPEELLLFNGAAVEAISGTPTEAPATSSAGRSGTSGASTARSSSARAKGSKR